MGGRRKAKGKGKFVGVQAADFDSNVKSRIFCHFSPPGFVKESGSSGRMETASATDSPRNIRAPVGAYQTPLAALPLVFRSRGVCSFVSSLDGSAPRIPTDFSPQPSRGAGKGVCMFPAGFVHALFVMVGTSVAAAFSRSCLQRAFLESRLLYLFLIHVFTTTAWHHVRRVHTHTPGFLLLRLGRRNGLSSDPPSRPTCVRSRASKTRVRWSLGESASPLQISETLSSSSSSLCLFNHVQTGACSYAFRLTKRFLISLILRSRDSRALSSASTCPRVSHANHSYLPGSTRQRRTGASTCPRR